MTRFVTGGAGFIGGRLVRTLAARGLAASTICLVRTSAQAAALQPLGVRVVVGDLAAPAPWRQALDGVEIVYHLAACVRYGLRGAAGAPFDRENVEGTRALLESCPATVRRFIQMSTINAVERPPGDPATHPLTEESPACPQTPYGQSKWKAEQVVRQVAEAKRIPFLILRPPSLVYGAGCRRDSGMATVIQSVASRSLMTALNWPGRFSLIHVQDLVEATIALGGSATLANATFFLCQEPPVTLGELADAIASQLGIARRRVRLPGPLYAAANGACTLLAWVPGLGRRIPFQLLMLLRDQAAVSSQSARMLAGFTTRISLAEGLRDTIPWVLTAETTHG